MAFDFPSAPTNGQQFGNYYWDAATGAWRNLGSKDALAQRLTALENVSGRILQVASTSTNVQVTNSTSTNANTGLSITFTPKKANSSLLIFVNQNGIQKTNQNAANRMGLELLRDSTSIALIGAGLNQTDTLSFLVTPSASTIIRDPAGGTATRTYRTVFRNDANLASVSVQMYSSLSTMLILEISE